jgi:nucleoside-diphosphate-sugar epimerase
MKVLVTGAAGFVGCALCEHLRQHGVQVRRAVRVASAPERETFAVGDIGPDTDWSDALTGVDAVVHLAARVHLMRDHVADPLAEYRRVNAEAVRRLATMAGKAGVSRFVFLSSVKVNGEGAERCYDEADPVQPRDAYAQSKWEGEQALRKAAAHTGMQWTILRPPLVYGPGVRSNFLRLMSALARGIPLPLGAVRNRRSLLFIGNLVDAARVCLSLPAAANRVFMISDGEDVTSAELARRLARALDVRPRLMAIPVPLLRAAGRLGGCSATVERLVGSLCVDSASIRDALDWRPPHSLDEGLTHTARWYLAAHGKAA